MKKIISNKITLSLAVIVLSILSCSKDDGDVPTIKATNTLEYQGKSYGLDGGAVTDYGYDGEHYNTEFNLMQLSRGDANVIPVYLFMDIFSAGEEFKSGVYTYQNDVSDVDGKNYFDEGYFVLNLNLANDEAEAYSAISKGTVKIVTGGGSKYSIEFDLTLENGESVKGSFEGTFEQLEPED